MEPIRIYVLTVSDSSYANRDLDKSGPALKKLIKKNFKNYVIRNEIVPDDVETIKATLIKNSPSCDVIFTTGGTGFAPRDVTPEATSAVIDKKTSGLIYAMLAKSLPVTEFSMLSRAVAGIRDTTLIINLPGSQKAVEECFNIVKNVIPHAICLIQGKDEKEFHKMMMPEFVPSKVKLNAVAARKRESHYPMIEVAQAHDIIMSVCTAGYKIDEIDLEDALGRVLAEDAHSYDPLPPFPSSIKDGYAVIAADGAGERQVIDAVIAGSDMKLTSIQPGQCVRISTGAPIPPGADAVVQVEDTTLLKASEDLSTELVVDILKAPTEGQDIRKIGSDIEQHKVLLKKGSILSAAALGVLAAIGKPVVRVFQQLNVGIISTGNEIQDYKEPLQEGRIRDSNKITLKNLLKEYGYKSVDCGIARDDPNSIKRALQQAMSKCDLIISTGGVSMGECDLLKQVLIEDFSAKIHFGRVNMKPGKPTTFATCMYNGVLKMIFALPGNPVSATVTCLLYVIPVLRYYENRPQVWFPKIQVTLGFTPTFDSRPEYHRVYFKDENNKVALSTGNQISSRLNSCVGVEGLVILPPAPKPMFEPMNGHPENTVQEARQHEANTFNFGLRICATETQQKPDPSFRLGCFTTQDPGKKSPLSNQLSVSFTCLLLRK